MNYFKLILFFLPLLGYTQENLILNGNFEEYWECPEALTEIEKCKYVYNPCYADPPNWSSTSDYFNECSESEAGVPNNIEGHQYARSGKGYVGLVTYLQPNTHYSEYIQLEFSQELIQGATYQFTIYSNLSNNVEYSTKNIQFKFLDSNDDYSVLLDGIMTPDYRYDTIIKDTLQWEKITFKYQANGNEKYLIIGNFDSLNNTSFDYLYDIPNVDLGLYSYNYFDDAELILVKEAEPIKIPNVFTPNNDGINDTFDLISGYVLFDEIIIRNRWGNVVHQSKQNAQWDGNNQNGNPLSEGVYFVQVITKREDEKGKKEQYNGIVHLIR